MSCQRAMIGILIAAVCLLRTSVLAGQISGESDSSAFVLRLEIDKPAYLAGDSIKVRLTLRNTLPDTVKVRNGVLVDLIQLSVYDSAGHLLTPGVRTYPFFSGPPTWLLAPWAQVSLKGSDGSYWSNLRDWGYELRVAGQYTIVAVPQLAIRNLASGGPANPPKVKIAVRSKRSGLWPVLLLMVAMAGIVLAGVWAKRLLTR